MTRAGDIINANSGLLSDWFEEPLTVRNYVAGAADDYGDADKQLSSESPIETVGRVEMSDDPQEVSRGSGETTVADVDILLPSDVVISDGSNVTSTESGVAYGGSSTPEDSALVYPSEIETEAGVVYEVAHIHDEMNGRYRVLAVDSEEGV